MNYLNYSVSLLKIGRSGNQLKLSLGKEAIKHMGIMQGDSIRWQLYRDRHLLLIRCDSDSDEPDIPTDALPLPMWRTVNVEIRGSYRRCTIPRVFAKLLNLTLHDYVACRHVENFALHAWPVRRQDILALDPLYTLKGHNS